MKRGLIVTVCTSCGRTVFPPRVLCPACGGAAWRTELVDKGVVEEVTTVHRAVGVVGEEPVTLASVRLAAGPVVIARLDGPGAVGGRVELAVEEGAPVARPPHGRARGTVA
jgi:uncharacterized OB-fold protein